MKKLTLISLFVFFAAVVAILVEGLVFYQDKKNTLSVSPSGSTEEIILDDAEISKHSTADDCWLIISDKVYNVTSYIASHPGGPEAIILNCGKDATTAFLTKGGSGHSQSAVDNLVNYYLGDLKQPLSSLE